MLNATVVTMRPIILNYRFMIPKYQRPYAWEEDQITELWEDIKNAWECRNKNQLNNSKHNHFLGSILTTDVPNGHPGQLYIIDGQQRMTSLTIFAAALLDVCKKHNVNEAIFNLLFRDQPSPFIVLNEGHEYMYKVIIEPSRAMDSYQARTNAFVNNTMLTEVHSNIHDNYKALYNSINNYINNMPELNKQNCLKEILDTFLDYLYIVRIHVPNDNNIIRIFRTLNDRGVDLSVGDIAKSIIFESVLNNQPALDLVSELWQDTFEQIESDNKTDVITSYLRHYHISTRSYVAEGNLTTEIENLVNQSPVNNTPPAVTLLRGMKDEAKHYNTLLQSNSQSPETNSHITIIRECLKVTLCFPALLAALEHWHQHPVTMNKFLHLTENFLFRYFHIQSNKNIPALETFMSDVAKVIRTHQNALPIVQQMYKDKSADTSFHNAFLIANISPNTAKYVIGKLEGKNHVQLMSFITDKDFKSNYIMPKVPNQHFTKNDIDVDCHRRIGNLFIWPIKLKFDRTLNVLRNQQQNPLPISLNSILQVLNKHQYWGPDAIIDRQTILAKDVNDIWSLS